MMLDPILRLPSLEAELVSLDMTIRMKKRDGGDEDARLDNKRQKLRSEIDDVKTAAEFSVRKAQYRFYEAFTNSDLDAMRSVWSDSTDVRCIHPGMECIDGINDIMFSWQQIFGPNSTAAAAAKNQGRTPSPTPSSFMIEPDRSKIQIFGVTAMCSCIEKTQPGNGLLECLNVYRREDGEWKMILHMASPIVMRTSKSGGSGGSGSGSGGPQAFF
jgi:hypothetical protein